MPKKYEPIHPPIVEAEEVTVENIREVTKWCQGVIHKGVGIRVVVSRGQTIRVAFFGDYVVKSGAGDFSVMTAPAFESRYKEKIDGE